MKKQSFKKREQGQSIVEFALVAPILVLLLFGIIEFGRIFETVNVLTSAAREGARVAAVTAPNLSQVQAAVNTVLQAGNIGGTPTITLTGPNAASQITVTVQVQYIPMTGNIVPGISNLTFTRASVMRWEG
ncbi:pilus assembly protein [candidate division KSB1 bacterium]|nr:pilus assembly protein [candidate division KSB1 bacterium]